MPGVLLLSEQGRPRSATVAARRLLGRVAAREHVPATLRSLYARQALADPDEPVVTTLVLADGRRLASLHAFRARATSPSRSKGRDPSPKKKRAARARRSR